IIGAARSDFRAVSRINRDRESSFRIDEFTGKTAYGLKTLVSGSSSGTGLSKTPCAATTYEVRDLDHTSPKSASGTFWRRTRSPNQDRPLIVKQPSKDKERNVMHLIILVLAQTQNNRNVFKPNPNRTLPQTTPMSTSTRISCKPEHNNSTAQQQPKPNWIAEELFNTEKRKVDGKLNDIFPSTYETVPSFSVRIKRGLINGLGSIFKAITGNLDASDGEKFESLISDLQNDQNKLSEAINSQNTLSVELIDNFNKTGLFKVVIPSGKYLVKNELYFAFAGDACTETVTKQYVCKELDLRRIKESNPCEVQLLVQKTPTTCREVEAVITEPVMKKLHDFGQWILLISNETTITLSCQEGQETVKVLGSYLAEIPVGCTLELNQEPISIGSQPIIFPNIDSNTTMLPSRMTSAFI
ncbi:unnamed protein product, partial [Acanthoscelides obtectus]